MGRIKTTLVKRTARGLIEKTPETFNKEFEHNKKALGHEMPSKKIRNIIAGYLTRLKRNTRKIINQEEAQNGRN